MSDLATLEAKYREAQEVFSDDPTEENHKEYRRAKAEFTAARVEERQAEEADPNLPRGDALVVVDNGEGE